jgi:hypothetical protein
MILIRVWYLCSEATSNKSGGDHNAILAPECNGITSVGPAAAEMSQIASERLKL